MAYYVQEERAPECSLFDVPLIGAVSDSLCCQGPKRDFATEEEFRLANAVKMYPAGYVDAPGYAYGYHYQHGGNAPSYWHYKPPTTMNYPPATAAVAPVGYCPYPVQRPPQAQRWAYYYEPENYTHSRPVVPPVEAALHERFSSSWAGALGGASPPMEPRGMPAQLGITAQASQPRATPGSEAFAPSEWRTVEVVKVLSLVEQGRKTGQNPEQKKELPQGQQFESKASQTESKDGTSKAVKEGRAVQRAPAAKRKPAAAKKVQRSQARLQQPEGDDAIRDDTIPEPTKGDTPDSNPASTPSVDAEQASDKAEPNDTGKDPKEEGKRGDAVSSETDTTEKQLPSGGPNQQPAMETSSKKEAKGWTQSSDEPSAAGGEKLPFSDTQNRFEITASTSGGNTNGFAFVSVEMSAPSVGSTLGSTSPGPQKSPGKNVEQREPRTDQRHFYPTPVGRMAEPPGATNNWPVGYVPPPDDKYKELVVGSQVYLEGGTFYLSETGAYLLGLRG